MYNAGAYSWQTKYISISIIPLADKKCSLVMRMKRIHQTRQIFYNSIVRNSSFGTPALLNCTANIDRLIKVLGTSRLFITDNAFESLCMSLISIALLL